MLSVLIATIAIPSWCVKRGRPTLAAGLFAMFGVLYWLAMATVIWRLPA
jgi:hypothetical protein